MDYSFFDALIDSVFVIKDDRGIVYCNESAAKLCDSSVRRLSKGKPIFEFIEFEDPELFVMPEGTTGKESPAPYTEIQYKLKTGKQGKVQVAIQPFKEASGEPRWAIMVRDVTLEEVLHAKNLEKLKQLEAYSKNLEQMVEERTQEVKRANVMLNAIMNSLGQGFFVFDDKGVCADFYTKACETILEDVPAGKQVVDVLRVPEKDKNTFQMWLDSSFKEMLPFDSLKELGPKRFPHSKDHQIHLDYYPLRGEAGAIERIVVVATDQTAEFVAQQALEKEKRFAKMVVKLVTSKKQFGDFVINAGKTIDQTIQAARRSAPDNFDHQTFFRVLHTLEGESATYSVMDVWQSSRQAQEVLEPMKRGESPEWKSFIAAFTASLEELKKTYDHFMEANKNLFQLVGIGGERKIEVERSVAEKVVTDLRRRNVDHAVCEEIENLFLKESVVHSLRHYDDVVAVVAAKCGKKMAPIRFIGEDVRVNADRFENLFSTFVHAFRNIVDHGVEPAEEREMVGKPAEGNIHVEVRRVEDNSGAPWLEVTVKDDGQGINIAKMREKIGTSGANADALSDHEVAQYVFASGISTKDEIGEFSGRGIGMNAIKAEAEALGGTAIVENHPGQGMTLIVRVPDFDPVANVKRSA